MAKCKCKICGKVMDSSDAYLCIVGSKKIFFCNQNEYTLWKTEEDKKKAIKEQMKADKAAKDEQERKIKQKAKADKDAVWYAIIKIFGYEVQHTTLFKEWELWKKIKPNAEIAQYLVENEEYLIQTMSRIDCDEYKRIRYFSAILKNHLRDFKAKKVEEVVQKPDMEEHYETKYKHKERRGLIDLEEEYDE